MTVEITVGSTAGLPDAASFDGGATTLACPDKDASYRVLRSVMDYSYDHPELSCVTLVCASEEIAASYRFQWNMWYAERKPD